MATGNTCGGTDNTLPKDLLEQLRIYLNAHPERTKHYKTRTHQTERKHLDADDCCLLEDLSGIYCGSDRCCHAESGKKTRNPNGTDYTPHKPMNPD